MVVWVCITGEVTGGERKAHLFSSLGGMDPGTLHQGILIELPHAVTQELTILILYCFAGTVGDLTVSPVHETVDHGQQHFVSNWTRWGVTKKVRRLAEKWHDRLRLRNMKS